MAIESISKSDNVFPYLELAIIISIVQTLFEQYLNLRQLRRLNKYDSLPKTLEPFNVEYEEYKKAKIYSKDKMQFEIITDLFKSVLDICLKWFFYYPYLWKLCRTIVTQLGYEDSEYKRIPILILIEILRENFINIPLSLYKDFVIEERHGFNKKTLGLFIKDTLISFVLIMTLAVPIVLGLVWVIEVGGKYFYIYVEIFVIIIALLIITIYPHFIAPLFNKFTELEEGKLKEKINELASKVSFPLKKVFVIDGSKRSSHSNAYFFGLGNNKRIVLFDTLIKQMNDEEILAVLCHELGHWQFGHMWKQMANSFLQIFIMFYCYGFFSTNDQLFQSFGFDEKSIIIGIGLFLGIYSPISFVLGAISLKLSRTFEFQADSYATDFGYGELLSSGLVKLFKENSGDMDPDLIYASFHYTHPTFVERLTFLRELGKKEK
jgi:STE24 endopeptidase